MADHDWEGEYGKAYRAEHKRTHYEAVTLQFRKDAPDGLTRSKIQEIAAAHGQTAGQYIMNILRNQLKGE